MMVVLSQLVVMEGVWGLAVLRARHMATIVMVDFIPLKVRL